MAHQSAPSSSADTVTVNVGTLSNVLAVAIQQAAGATASSQSQSAAGCSQSQAFSGGETEVRSVFVKAMGGKHDFPFLFLQPTGSGSRSLSMPAISTSFQWTSQQVAKLGANKQTIYILATDELELVSAVPKCYMCMET